MPIKSKKLMKYHDVDEIPWYLWISMMKILNTFMKFYDGIPWCLRNIIKIFHDVYEILWRNFMIFMIFYDEIPDSFTIMKFYDIYEVQEEIRNGKETKYKW